MIGKTERGFVAEGFDHYINRITKKQPIEILILPEAGKGDPDFQQRTEGDRTQAVLRTGEKLVLLDEKGKQFSSPGFADQLQNWRDKGIRGCAFVIGGAYGHSDHLRERADLIISLSSMTFPHQLVRILFAEQLYRAYTIMEGGPYHH
ncbi:MAG: 23S rRNA (pseudouridine(1915)-N(3))-methyltransferase RlmH [Bacteroidota bacterium]|nr:23S rRNA (pseudouridine(1915)-N(3))-methyltransferase RlmH [Bacteroidota bacterium]